MLFSVKPKRNYIPERGKLILHPQTKTIFLELKKAFDVTNSIKEGLNICAPVADLCHLNSLCGRPVILAKI